MLGSGGYRIIHVAETGGEHYVAILLHDQPVDDSGRVPLGDGFHIHRLQPVLLLLRVLTSYIVGVGPAVVPHRTDVDETRLDRLGLFNLFLLLAADQYNGRRKQADNQHCQHLLRNFHSSLRGFVRI